MPTLKEIKGRISSVKNTLKITSAMKLVASAKLRRAQQAIAALRPYEQQLTRILANLSDGAVRDGTASTESGDPVRGGRVIIAMASNSSLCGGFNANVIAKVRAVRQEGDTVISIGRKMADAMRKDGFPSPEDFTALAEHPAYTPCADLVSRLLEEAAAGRMGEVLLVYNHFVSTAKQTPVVETLIGTEDSGSVAEGNYFSQGFAKNQFPSAVSQDYIIEPSRKELLELLLPKTTKLKLYAALLDSAAAEHAARTVAMQTATDNGENLLSEFTLQYNKGRQQKITSEILDLAGGQAES